jgi:hypothetical protein
MTRTWAGWIAHRLPKPIRRSAAVERRSATRSRKSVEIDPIGEASPAAAEASTTWTGIASSSRSSRTAGCRLLRTGPARQVQVAAPAGAWPGSSRGGWWEYSRPVPDSRVDRTGVQVGLHPGQRPVVGDTGEHRNAGRLLSAGAGWSVRPRSAIRGRPSPRGSRTAGAPPLISAFLVAAGGTGTMRLLDEGHRTPGTVAGATTAMEPSAEAGEYVHHVPSQVVGGLTRAGTTNLRSCG